MLEKNIFKSKNGFTLAEVLLTLLIIGIVAAMVIPAVITAAENQANTAALKKVYSELTQASKLLMMDNGGTFVGLWNTNDKMMNSFSNYLNFTQKCLANTQPGVCFHDGTTSWKTISGNYGWFDPTLYSRAVTNNGMLFRFIMNASDCTTVSYGVENNCGHISVDVNGFKPPNVYGRDIFHFQVTKTSIIPAGSTGTITDFSVYCNPSYATSTGVSCAARVLKENGINY